MAVVLNRSAVSNISFFSPVLKTKLGLFKLSLRHLRTLTIATYTLFRFQAEKRRHVENETSVD